MKSSIQFIRNATLVLSYAGKKFLIDPMFADKGAYPGFPGTVNSELRNPLVEMPVNPKSLFDVEAVFVSHLHPDHWDEAAANLLPKDIKIFAQNEADAGVIRSQGFTNVEALDLDTNIGGIALKKTVCQHGTDVVYSIPPLAELLGYPTGYFFKSKGEKSIYILGDTIWINEVEENLKNLQPDVVVINAGKASLAESSLGAVTMGEEDVEKVHNILPNATIIVVHMEALNHCVLGRNEVQEFVKEKGFAKKVIIPIDGEFIDL